MRNINIFTTAIFTSLLIICFVLISFNVSDASEHESMKDDSKTIELSSVNDSGIKGIVKLKPEGEKTRVLVLLKGTPEGVSQPIHIHKGNCNELGAPKYPLNPVKEGKSKTTIDASLNDLISGEFAINAHKSKEEIQNYVACGNIEKK